MAHAHFTLSSKG